MRKGRDSAALSEHFTLQLRARLGIVFSALGVTLLLG